MTGEFAVRPAPRALGGRVQGGEDQPDLGSDERRAADQVTGCRRLEEPSAMRDGVPGDVEVGVDEQLQPMILQPRS